MSYNAALRAIRLGYRNVLWYRGGIEAWKSAGLPMGSSAGQGQPPMGQPYRGQPKGNRPPGALPPEAFGHLAEHASALHALVALRRTSFLSDVSGGGSASAR